MFVEDLPMWGYIGDVVDEGLDLGIESTESKTYLFTHLHFLLGFNKNQIVAAKVTTDVSSLIRLGINKVPWFDISRTAGTHLRMVEN
jgi:hypothetical protein